MKFGRYKVIEELGKGAMGVVYKAHDPSIDRMVALKVLREDRVTSEAFVKRFLKEAMAIGRLSHANIVIVYDVGRDHGSVFIAEEFLEGLPLDKILRERKLETGEIVHFGLQMADALDYAHRKGIVHRDIKPSNIISTPEDRIKITDFGIAHVEDPNAPKLTQAGEILGTPFYMSPEQLMGKTIDGRSDLFSVGVILYEMAARKRPFTGKSLPSIFHAITEKMPPPPNQIEQQTPKALSNVILKALEKNPENRFTSGNEFADALKSIDLSPHEAKKSDLKPAKKSKKKLLAVAALAAAVFCAGGYWYYQNRMTVPDKPQIVTPDEKDIPDKPVIQMAELKVESDPLGAKVFLDGQLKGTTPLDLKLPFGKYEMRLSKENFYEWAGQINLEEKAPNPLSIKLNPLIF